jgi:hypothetical protein
LWTIPYRDQATAREVVKMYYKGLFHIYGLPLKIIIDRGLQFITDFADKIVKIVGIK